MKTYKGLIGEPANKNQVLVGGTNPEGRHGLGVAALGYKHWGAIYGVGYGMQGQFFGIVTKDLRESTHPSVNAQHIIDQILGLYAYAEANPHLEFLIAYSAGGKNLNGYTDRQMALLFSNPLIPDNIVFEEGFSKLLNL